MEVRSDKRRVLCYGFISKRFCVTANHTILFKVRVSANICSCECIVIQKECMDHTTQRKLKSARGFCTYSFYSTTSSLFSANICCIAYSLNQVVLLYLKLFMDRYSKELNSATVFLYLFILLDSKFSNTNVCLIALLFTSICIVILEVLHGSLLKGSKLCQRFSYPTI